MSKWEQMEKNSREAMLEELGRKYPEADPKVKSLVEQIANHIYDSYSFGRLLKSDEDSPEKVTIDTAELIFMAGDLRNALVFALVDGGMTKAVLDLLKREMQGRDTTVPAKADN